MIRVAILGSGKGSNAQAILQAQRDNRLYPAQITHILSDQPRAGILQLGERDGSVDCRFLDPGPFQTKFSTEAEESYVAFLQSQKIDLIVLAGFMRIIKKPLLDAFPRRIINIHPSLLPSFPGLNSIQQAMDYGVKVTGCTVHWVDETIDGGQIIDQAAIFVEREDTLDSLTQKVHQAEHKLLPACIQKVAESLQKLR